MYGSISSRRCSPKRYAPSWTHDSERVLSNDSWRKHVNHSWQNRCSRMHNMENAEHLHGSEMMSRARESDAHTNEAALSHARAAEVREERECMLASLRG